MRQAALFLVLILAAALAQAQGVPKPKSGAAPAPTTDQSARKSASVPAQNQEGPKRKSGLWEIKWTSARAQGKSHEMQMCVDQASDNLLAHLNEATRQESCKTSSLKRDGDQIVVDAVCSLGRITATSRAVITGKFDSEYKIETKSTYDPPLRGQTEGTASQAGRWLGPCQPDQKPGDVILASGKKINLNDRARASTAGKAGSMPGPMPGAAPSKRQAPTSQPAAPAPAPTK